MSVSKSFDYQNGYTYAEYKQMCDSFADVRLPFAKGIPVQYLLADYVFCVSQNRIQTGAKNVLKRYLGCFFTYAFEETKSENAADTAIVFTGDGKQRKDYVYSVEKIKEQIDGADVFCIQRDKKHFSLSNFFASTCLPFWACALKKKTGSFRLAWDAAVSLFRAIRQAKKLYKKRLKGYSKIVTFCEQWSIDAAVTQLAKKDGKKTITLQHGNGTEIFYTVTSDNLLCSSVGSKNNAIACGVDEGKIVVCGPMKYAGERYAYHPPARVQKIGVVFDGADNFQNNIELLQIAHAWSEKNGAVCLVRFHPSNDRTQYAEFMRQTDIVCEDLPSFEKQIDACLVYNSTLYTDMLYKKIAVYRYQNGKINLFPELNDTAFDSEEKLDGILNRLICQPSEALDEQLALRKQVFGDVDENAYANFFNDKQ